jgi:PqqD family protein of HPr-rel-A system
LTPASDLRWRIPADQRLVFEDFDDGILLFDGKVGSTHLMNATAAETLAIVEATPDLTTPQIHALLLARLELAPEALPLTALEELLGRLAALSLIAARLA